MNTASVLLVGKSKPTSSATFQLKYYYSTHSLVSHGSYLEQTPGQHPNS